MFFPLEVDYGVGEEVTLCESLDCEATQACFCSNCVCCSVCSAHCSCPQSTRDPDKKLAQILGFGDSNYWYIHNFLTPLHNEILKLLMNRKAREETVFAELDTYSSTEEDIESDGDNGDLEEPIDKELEDLLRVF